MKTMECVPAGFHLRPLDAASSRSDCRRGPGNNHEQLLPDITHACRAYYPDIARAVEWLRRNKTLFQSTVIEPRIIQMTEEEILQFIQEREEGSCSDFPRPTSFVFKKPDEFDLFLDQVRFEQGLKIDCEMLHIGSHGTSASVSGCDGQNLQEGWGVGVVSSVGCELQKPTWDLSTMIRFEKDLYNENSTTSQRSLDMVRQFYTVNKIRLKGHSSPKPIITIEEANFPEHVMGVLLQQNWVQPTPIQAQGWPSALSGRDLLCIAHSGSGKTLSYIIPSIIHVSQQPQLDGRDGAMCLVLVPTGELVQQVVHVASLFGSTSHIRITCLNDCISTGTQIQNLERGAEICIATPDVLLDFLADNGTYLRRCTYLVLDAADRMLALGFEPHLKQIVHQVRPDRQTLLFSGTSVKDIQNLADFLLNDYLLINIGANQLHDEFDHFEVVDINETEVTETRTSEITTVTFAVGQEFASYLELEKLLSIFSQQNYVQLWKRDCKTKEAAMRRCPKRAEIITPAVKYYHLNYSCIHGGQKFRKKGNGHRQTSTFKKDCPFSLKFDASPDGQRLVLTSYIDRHENHEMSEVLFKHLPKQRRLSNDEEARASSLLELQANKQLVQMKFAQETGRVITLRDLSNVASKRKRDISRNNVDNFVTTLKEKYYATVELLTCGNNLKGVFFQDKHMKVAYTCSPEFLCMDATYKLLEARFSVFIVMCEDGGGLSEVACVGLLVDEEASSIRWLLETFKKHNDSWPKTKVIMTDKDFTERAVIRTSFPGVSLLICLFHTLRSFSREITTAKLGITKGERFLALEIVQKIAYACSDEQYNALYEQLKLSVASPILAYYTSNWHDIRDEWVVGLKFSSGSFLNRTNNRLERFNGQLKTVIKRNSSLEEFLEKFYVLMSSLRCEHFHKVAYELHKTKSCKHLPGSPEYFYVTYLTRYAADFVLQQIALVSKVDRVEPIPDCDGVYAIESREGAIQVTTDSCQCMFRRAMTLPCRHILALRKKLESPLFEITLCANRWILSTYKETQGLYQAVNTGNTNITINVSETAEGRKALTQHEKFRLAAKELSELSALLSEVGNAEFERRLHTIRLLKKGWQDGQIMIVAPANAEAPQDLDASNVVAPEDVENYSDDFLLAQEDNQRVLLPYTSRTPLEPPTLNGTPINEHQEISLSEMQVPALIKKRGRPKGSDLTTIGLPRKKARNISKGGPKPFVKLTADAKTQMILNWLGVGDSEIKKSLTSKEVIKNFQVRTESINSAVLDEHVDIYLVRRLFTNTIWRKITEAVEEKRETNVWLCGSCNHNLSENGAIACDACFTWYHLPCCGMKCAPKKKTWICSNCSQAASLNT